MVVALYRAGDLILDVGRFLVGFCSAIQAVFQHRPSNPGDADFSAVCCFRFLFPVPEKRAWRHQS